jgi:hypothetical protein
VRACEADNDPARMLHQRKEREYKRVKRASIDLLPH